MGIEATLLIAGASAAIQVSQSQKAAKQAKRVGRQQADALRKEADVESRRQERLQASQRAAFGAAGVAGGAGTPLFVQAASLLESVRERERILAGARNTQSNANAQADALRIQGIAGALQTAGNATSQAIQQA